MDTLSSLTPERIPDTREGLGKGNTKRVKLRVRQACWQRHYVCTRTKVMSGLCGDAFSFYSDKRIIPLLTRACLTGIAPTFSEAPHFIIG